MGRWTDEGFVAQSIEYYKSAIQGVFREAFGDEFALDDTLPQGILIQRLAELFYAMDMDGVEGFARLNMNSAGGILLDLIGARRGISRILGAPQTGLAEITCRSENFSTFTLPAGTVLTAETGDTFTVNDSTTFSTTESTVSITYTTNGDSSAIVGNTMTVEGFPQIINIEIVSLYHGTDNETDLSYRSRLLKEYPSTIGTIEYIKSKLIALPTVRSVGVLYNDTDTTDGNSVPPYCTEFLVAPNEDVNESSIGVFKETVGKIILDNKVPGSPTYGNTTVTVPDVFGTQKAVNFTTATRVEINIKCTVKTPEETGVLDLSRESEIKETIANYINSLPVGIDVSYARCIAPLATDSGFDIVDFAMKATGDAEWTENTNYTIEARQYAGTDVSLIQLTLGS